jgi:hypothetical protein
MGVTYSWAEDNLLAFPPHLSPPAPAKLQRDLRQAEREFEWWLTW